jgi:sterol desaturase/sphingolipid hydroxylase (fatty acid hydroxylase superfamily)
MTPLQTDPRPAQAGLRQVFSEARVRLVTRRFGVFSLVLLTASLVLAGERVWLVPLGCLYGLVWWSFLEYLMHRFLLHWQPVTPRGREICRRVLLVQAHQEHHEEPMDAAGAVTTNHGIAVPVALILFLSMLVVGFSLPFALATMAGGAAGYLAYELVHYACHQSRIRMTGYGKLLRRHHALHHHADERANFGVTSPFWDWVFRTYHRHGPRGVGAV